MTDIRQQFFAPHAYEDSDLNAIQAVSKALQLKLGTFKRDPANENEQFLEGAALLAIDVGIIMNAPQLIAEAQQVINWLRDWEVEQELKIDQEMEASYAASQKAREPVVEAHRLAKVIVGREHQDQRWLLLVAAYQEAFPTFIVRNAVFARLHPKQLSYRLRGLLMDVIKDKRLGRSPTEMEMRECLPEAETRLQLQTVAYLERALPGYDFEGHAIMGNHKG